MSLQITVRTLLQISIPVFLLLFATGGRAETEQSDATQLKQEALLVGVVRDYGRKINKAEAAALEKVLEEDPEDLMARAKLLGYYFYQGVKQEGQAATIKARRRHITWLVRHHPESRLGGLSEATIDPEGHSLADRVGYETASSMWRAWVERGGATPQTIHNAFKFVSLNDKPGAEKIAKKVNDPLLLGQVYAWGVIRATLMNQNGLIMSTGTSREDDRYAEHAVEALRATDNTQVLDVATSILLMQGAIAQSLNRKAGKELEPKPVAFAGELLERCGECHTLTLYYKITGMMSRSPAEQKKLAQKELALLEKQSAVPPGVKPEDKKMVQVMGLIERTEVAFKAGDHVKAGNYANEMLGLLEGETLDDIYGAGAHKGHIVLGRIALAKGDVKAASKHLLDAGNVKGGPSLQSFGPNMALAKELLEHGKRDVVVAYLKRCKVFWDTGQKRLDQWINIVESGGVPNFGPNLVY